jgi:hypothetical protein
MFVMTLAALLSMFDARFGGAWLETTLSGNAGDGAGGFILLALWVVVIGAGFTALNRARRGLALLNKR